MHTRQSTIPWYVLQERNETYSDRPLYLHPQASLLRSIVAGPRSRHPEAGLDLCYVTDNSKHSAPVLPDVRKTLQFLIPSQSSPLLAHPPHIPNALTATQPTPLSNSLTTNMAPSGRYGSSVLKVQVILTARSTIELNTSHGQTIILPLLL